MVKNTLPGQFFIKQIPKIDLCTPTFGIFIMEKAVITGEKYQKHIRRMSLLVNAAFEMRRNPAVLPKQ